MKLLSSISIACALAGTVASATSTDPVGFITHTINGTNGNAPTSLSLIGPSLVRPIEYTGTTTADPSGLTTLTFPSGVPTTFGPADVLENTATGWWSTVISSTDTTITINDNFPSTGGGNATISVRKHNTIHSFLGDNNPGLSEFNGSNISTVDLVQILQPNQAVQSYFYSPAPPAPTAGWYAVVGFAPSNDVPILPGTAIIIKTSSATDLVFQSTGGVKETPTDIDVYTGLTIIIQPDAVGATLAETDFGDDIFQASAPAGTYDLLQFLGPVDGGGNQAFTSYTAAAAGTPFPQGTPIAVATFTDASSVVWPEGAGAVLNRNGANPDGILNLNGSTVSP